MRYDHFCGFLEAKMVISGPIISKSLILMADLSFWLIQVFLKARAFWFHVHKTRFFHVYICSLFACRTIQR